MNPRRGGLQSIRLLGELQLIGSDGRALTLPSSRKTRALLAYLIATGQSHRRERLCDLLWDGPDDPRAELRWSLTKIRPLLSGSGGNRLIADRERVRIDTSELPIDLATARSLIGKAADAAPTQALQEAIALFGGEFLDGLELPLCYRYQEWCMAEREAVSRLRLSILTTLVQRLQDVPAEALVYARTLAAADPLSEAGHAAIVRLLAREGRSNDALAHYEHASRMLETELGEAPSGELREAKASLQSGRPARARPELAVGASGTPATGPPATTSALVGRKSERAMVELIAVSPVPDANVLLLTGEPGIGKSRMLAHFCACGAGKQVYGARAYEAEAARPYGVFIDILREVLRQRTSEALDSHLGLLLPEIPVPPEGSRNREQLFDAVVGLLRQVAGQQPLVLAVDDVQWLDDAAASLLHYVARRCSPETGLLIACAGRSGEIDDNPAVARVVRSLKAESLLREIQLSALDAAETAELVRHIDPDLDGARIYAQSEGNPLFTLELAKALRHGQEGPGQTVDAVIAGQLASLTERAREALLCAAAHGRSFTLAHLAPQMSPDAAGLFAALGELERRGLVRAVGGDSYDFAHDLVRQTAYRSLSQPRRKLLHRHLVRALHPLAASDPALAPDLARHAALAGDDETAARACRLAGEQALRVFANAEAAGFAERGLRHAGRLPEAPATLELRIALLKVRVLAAAGPGMRPLPPLLDTIFEATKSAERLGLSAAAATGHYLMSVLHQEAGDRPGAQRSTLRAAAAGRTGKDDEARAEQLANTARCLLELEADIARSRELIAEAEAIASPLGLDLCELHWARGLLQRWDGDRRAISSLSDALALARRDQDRWREYKCLTWLAVLEHEFGHREAMEARCQEVKAVAARLGEDEVPLVETLRGLSMVANDNRSGTPVLARALTLLRAIDDKSYLAYALNGAAELHLRAGRREEARQCSAEALELASIMGRRNEIAVARAILTQVSTEPTSATDPRSALPRLDELSMRAKAALREAAHARGELPTAVPTLE